MTNRPRSDRRGTVLVLLLICLIPLMAFLALAIDLGMLAVAKTQAQDAADLAALAGVRSLDGNTQSGANNNYAAVVPTAQLVATKNKVLSAPLASSAVNVQIGRYVYNSTSQRFEGQFPGPSSENWTLVQATVTPNVSSQMAFSKVLSGVAPQLQAVATAVHRPRDVAIILDFSGSMRFQSLVGEPYSGARTSNNADGVVPVFGHYSSTSSQLTASSFTWPYDQANITATTSDGRGAICADFYTDSGGTPAFTSQPAGYGATPGGDNFLKTDNNTGASYAHTAAEVVNITTPGNSSRDATWESQGYAEFTGTFNGYTLGPEYYGKTFFVWPPNPVSDWRKLYFTYPGSATGMDDNSKLWNGSGNWQAPGASTYAINYSAILNFITSSPNPFPSRLQSGRILYYDQIPTTIDLSNNPPTDLNQRFWKDYIDYVLGTIDNGSGNYTEYGNQGYLGYGADDTWGTVRITAKSSLTGSPKPYMHYGDNPKRPRLRFWFGPLTMIDFLGNYNMWYQYTPYASRFCWWPGTCHEAPMYACKLGIRAALSDIQSNHPNDFVSLIMFSVPKSSSTDSGTRFNRPRVGLGRNYTNMQDSLWYPPATVGNSSATVRPYDADNLEVPRSFGGTCYAMPLMLAYNQFSGASSLVNYNTGAPAGDAGGNGRKGAQKIVIFETDGAPNTTASASITNGGANNSYYNIRYNSANPGGSQYPGSINGYSDNSSTVVSQINTICQNICNLESAGTPGYSTSTKPVQIHCIGFGPQFSPSGPSLAANTATLNGMQQIGNVTDGMPSYKLVYGTEAAVVSKLQQAIVKILESTVPVALVR